MVNIIWKKGLQNLASSLYQGKPSAFSPTNGSVSLAELCMSWEQRR